MVQITSTENSTEDLTWKSLLSDEKKQSYFQKILEFLRQQYLQNKIIYPSHENIFNALRLTPFNKVKVVIIGQDPYHGPNQAHGLSFSVPPGVPLPPSLQNIFTELKRDLHIEIPSNGCLEHWAEQGVLLLNAILTVEANKPQSHANIGWQQFTDRVITCLNEHPKPIIFLLWGSYAQRKAELIDTRKHYILKAPHPSPLSAHRGFFGCGHFSKTNQLLRESGREEIDWSLKTVPAKT